MFSHVPFPHGLSFDSFVVVALSGGVFLDVIGCGLRGSGVPMRLMAGAHLMILRRSVGRILCGLARAEDQCQSGTKEKNNKFPIFFIRNHFLEN